MLDDRVKPDQVIIDTSDSARGRYPHGYVLVANRRWFNFEWAPPGGGDLAGYDVLVADRDATLWVSDDDDEPKARVLGPDALLSAVAQGRGVDHPDWTVHTPFSDAIDTRAVARGIAEGRIGSAQTFQITVSVGDPKITRHDIDWYFPLSLGESLYLALDLAESLGGGPIAETRPISRRDAESVWLAHSELGCDIFVRLVNPSTSNLRGFMGEVRGSEGRAVLRGEFAYGAVGWQRRQGEIAFKSAQMEKDSLQHPETVPGGWELFYALARAQGEVGSERGIPDAVRLANHVATLL